MSNWEEKRLGELVNIIDGDRGINYPKANEFFSNEYCLFLNTGNVTKEGFDFSNCNFITAEKDLKLRKGKLLRGDIVFTTRGTIGNSGFYKNSLNFENIRINSGMVILRSSNLINNYYLYKLLKSKNSQEIFGLFSSGSAQPQLPIKDFKKIKIKIPDLATQERIADILSAYDDLIENNNRRIELLEKAAQDLYKEWFVRFRFPNYQNTKFVNGLPEGWEVYSISKICETVGGGTPSTSVIEYWENGEVMWATPTDITNNKNIVLLDVEKRISHIGLKKSSAKLLPPNTILMTSRASIGFFGIIDKNICTNQGFISILPFDIKSTYFILFNLLSRKDEIEARATGATFKEISKSSFRKIKIVYPHKNILEKYNELTKIQFDNIRLLKKQNQNLKKQRDLLLPRLMSGNLEV